MSEGKKVVGGKPEERDEYWLKIAEKITPEESMTRLDTHGKYLFSTVAIVGTLLTGFGIVSTNTRVTPWLLIPILLACLSLALAMSGITPRAYRIARQSPSDIADHYNNVIRHRGWLVSAAGYLFALSVFSVALVLLVAARGSKPIGNSSIRLVTLGDTTRLAGVANFHSYPIASRVEAEVIGIKNGKTGDTRTMLFQQIANPDTAGNLSISAELNSVRSFDRYLLRTRVRSGSALLYQDSVEVARK
jgi:hypothetical protein